MKPTNCRQCNQYLQPEEGLPSPSLPQWVPGYGRYLCPRCHAHWKLWFEMQDQANESLARITYWISTQLPNLPYPVMRYNILDYIDQAAYGQARVRSIIYSSGLAYAPVAYYIAENLYHLPNPLDRVDDMLSLCNTVRQIVINRISKVIVIPLMQEISL